MTIYGNVNCHLRGPQYRPWMVTTTTPKKRGSAKGVSKPTARTLDAGFPDRLRQAMREAQPNPHTVPTLAPVVGCARATLLNYLSGDQKVADPILLLHIAEALRVRPQWLILGTVPMRDLISTPQYSDQAREAAEFIDNGNPESRRRRLVSGIKSIATLLDEEHASDDEMQKVSGGAFVRPDSALGAKVRRDAITRAVKQPKAGTNPLPGFEAPE